MRIHSLKVWPEFFEALESGKKTFEVRRDSDRGFAVGDMLNLKEFEPSPSGGHYTDRQINRKIVYKLPGGKFGIDPDFCVLGLEAE